MTGQLRVKTKLSAGVPAIVAGADTTRPDSWLTDSGVRNRACALQNIESSAPRGEFRSDGARATFAVDELPLHREIRRGTPDHVHLENGIRRESDSLPAAGGGKAGTLIPTGATT
jgi:hypothetical protein